MHLLGLWHTNTLAELILFLNRVNTHNDIDCPISPAQ